MLEATAPILAYLRALSPHTIDTLQLVNYSFSTFIERHRCVYLPRHKLDITIRAFHGESPIYSDWNCDRRDGYGKPAAYISLSNAQAIASRLVSSRVGYIQRLCIRREAIASANIGEGMQWLSAWLLTEMISIKTLEIVATDDNHSASEQPSPSLLVALTQLNKVAKCLVVEDGIDGEFLPCYPTLSQGVAHLVCSSVWWHGSSTNSTMNAIRLLFNENFTGMAIFVINLNYMTRDVGAGITHVAELYASGRFSEQQKDANKKGLIIAYRIHRNGREFEEDWTRTDRLGVHCERVIMAENAFKSWQGMDWRSSHFPRPLLKQNEWTVWRLRSSQQRHEHLRVMRMAVHPPYGEDYLTVHFRIIRRRLVDGDEAELDGDITTAMENDISGK